MTDKDIENMIYASVYLNIKECVSHLTLDQLAIFATRALQGKDCRGYSWYPYVKDCYEGGMTPMHLSPVGERALQSIVGDMLPTSEDKDYEI